MYPRILKKQIQQKFFSGKALLLTGARQTGKTTLSLELIHEMVHQKQLKVFNCDNPTDRELLTNKDLDFLRHLVAEAKVIFIDEGQKVTTIGQTVKLLVDFYKKEKQILVTGSSSINLLDSVEEALTGRKFVYTLFPLSLEESFPDKDILTITKELETLMIFGSYPDVVKEISLEKKIELLRELHSSYLYKDIFEFQRIKNSDLVIKLVKALALQIGSEVSYSELANLVGIDKKTVEHYLDLLEKSFVIFRLSPYTRNKRREISQLKKVYFYDLGIRHAVINNFNFLENRNDVGAIWENFAIVERLKYRQYHNLYASQYFWRTYDGSEVDLIEEREGKLYGYECKWGKKFKEHHKPLRWLEYPESSFQYITPSHLIDFVL